MDTISDVSNSDELSKIKALKSVECQIMTTGYKNVHIKYYFCSCDLDQKEPMCEACIKNCHKGHQVVDCYEVNAICSCGSKLHKVTEVGNGLDRRIQPGCNFHTWSQITNVNVYFETDKGLSICMFCSNFCDHKGVRKQTMSPVPECECTDSIHDDQKKIIKKLNSVVKIENKFENLTPLHFINLFLAQKEDPNSIFQNMFENLAGLRKGSFEPNTNLKYTTFFHSLDFIKNLCNSTKLFYFSNPEALEIFSQDFVYKFLEKKLDYKNDSVWDLKLHLILMYRKLVFYKDFANLPKLTIRDLDNLDPLHRMLVVSNLKNEKTLMDKYVYSIGPNTLDKTIDLIGKLNNFKEKHYNTYGILRNLYLICKKFAKYNMFNHDLLIKYCRINDEVIFKFSNNSSIFLRNNKETNKSKFVTEELTMLVPMVKSLLFLIYHYNDQLIDNLLRDKRKIEHLQFFHSNCELGKIINKNCINIMSFLRSNKDLQSTKVVSKILDYSVQIISISIKYIDNYDVSLRRIMDKNKEIYLDYIDGDFKDSATEAFHAEMEGESKKILELNDQFFNFKIDSEELISQVNTILEKFLNRGEFREDSRNPSIVGENQENRHILNEYVVDKNDQNGMRAYIRPKSLNLRQGSNDPSTLPKRCRIVMNKSFFIFHAINTVKVLHLQNQYKHASHDKRFNQLPAEFLGNIFSTMELFIKDSPDNCLLLLGSEITFVLRSIPKQYMGRVIEIFCYMLRLLKANKKSFASTNNVYKSIHEILTDISGEPEHVPDLIKVLEILKLLLDIDTSDDEFQLTMIREMLKEIFRFNDILGKFRGFFVDPEESQNLLLLHKHSFGEGVTNREALLNQGYDPENSLEFYTSFLHLVNICFDGNSTLNEIEFLETILNSSDAREMLENREINLELRIEVIKFFRMVYIDVIIDEKKIDEYRKVFVEPLGSQVAAENDDQSIFAFMQKLFEINSYQSGIDAQCDLLIYEMKVFKEIANKHAANKDLVKQYFEHGVLLPTYVLVNKFMAVIYTLNGYSYLKLYELVYWFLELKRFLIQREDLISKEITLKYKSGFKNFYKKQIQSHSLIQMKFNPEELNSVETDLKGMKSPSFEVLNFNLVHSIFENHMKGFIKQPKAKSLNKFFNKSFLFYDEKRTQKLEKNLKGMGLLESDFEKKAISAILKYENSKADFQDSSFVQNLFEQNLHYDANYRYLLLRSIFYLVTDDSNSVKFRNQNLYFLLKLLQFDTKPTQDEVLALQNESSKNNFFSIIIKSFFKNLLSLIFASYNPSTTALNEDYFVAIVIVKILKFLCEEHNEHFQTIFFQQVNVSFLEEDNSKGVKMSQFEPENQALSIFDFMLHILEKILKLSKWNKVDFNSEDNNIIYFYDIFFAIVEFLVEMVQGTRKENLQAILDNTYDREFTPFQYFLLSAKNILLRDKHYSHVLYRVRNDIIDFIVAFLEEKNTPPKLILSIANIISPTQVFESIINTLKKLYASLNPDEAKRIAAEPENYKKIILDDKKSEFFYNTFMSSEDFRESPEFTFANRMYQYVKLLAAESKNEDALNIINAVTRINEDKMISLYHKKLQSSDRMTKLNAGDLVFEEVNIQVYFAVKFFEKITRTVLIYKDGATVRVLFTLNPSATYLSTNTMKDFEQNVNRDSRYSKLYSLMESCDYFYDEINYNLEKANNSKTIQIINKFHFYNAEVFTLLVTLLINLLMVFGFNKPDETEGDATFDPIIISIGIFHMIANLTFLAMWMYGKFPLYYHIEKQKYGNKFGIEELNISQKLAIATYHTILAKNEINAFIWNIAMSAVGITSPKNFFLFSVELLAIVNLSITLKNILRAVTLRYKQLLATSMFVFIILYVFSCIAFFFLNRDFNTVLEGVES